MENLRSFVSLGLGTLPTPPYFVTPWAHYLTNSHRLYRCRRECQLSSLKSDSAASVRFCRTPAPVAWCFVAQRPLDGCLILPLWQALLTGPHMRTSPRVERLGGSIDHIRCPAQQLRPAFRPNIRIAYLNFHFFDQNALIHYSVRRRFCCARCHRRPDGHHPRRRIAGAQTEHPERDRYQRRLLLPVL